MDTAPLARIATGIEGLDTVLCGGLTAGSVMIVQGPPGAGKTILANQICFNRALADERSLYITLLAESHDRLIRHMATLRFFDATRIPEHIYYISAFDRLLADGLPGILNLLRTESSAHGAKFIVLDGLFVIEDAAASQAEFRKFVNDLATLANLTGCTVIVLTNTRHEPRTRPEHTMVDIWVQLDAQLSDYRAYRELVVHKFRGSDFRDGRHAFSISDEGVRVFPRFEQGVGRTSHVAPRPESVPTGVPGLDAMLECKGLPGGSSTLVLGPSGVGKTTLGLHFLSGCSAEEPALFCGFNESPAHLQAKAAQLGLGLEAVSGRGVMAFEWRSVEEHSLDEIAYRVLATVRERGVRRLVMDGIDGLRQANIYPQRLPGFLAALAAALREEGVTTLFTARIPQLIGGDTEIDLGDVTAAAENIVLMRYRESLGELQRTVAVVKCRESAVDHRIRRFTIEAHGIRIGDPVQMGLPPAIL